MFVMSHYSVKLCLSHRRSASVWMMSLSHVRFISPRPSLTVCLKRLRRAKEREKERDRGLMGNGEQKDDARFLSLCPSVTFTVQREKHYYHQTSVWDSCSSTHTQAVTFMLITGVALRTSSHLYPAVKASLISSCLPYSSINVSNSFHSPC